MNHPDLDKVAFTGSTEVGKAIQKALANRETKLTLELGGKAAHIIFEDATIDQAVEGIINGIYFNQGHVCCAVPNTRNMPREISNLRLAGTSSKKTRKEMSSAALVYLA